MSIRIQNILDEIQPFSENMLIKVRDHQGQLVSVKNITYQFSGDMDEAVLVFEISDKPKKIEWMHANEHLRAERDELLAALKSVIELPGFDLLDNSHIESWQQAESLLAKLEPRDDE